MKPANVDDQEPSSGVGYLDPMLVAGNRLGQLVPAAASTTVQLQGNLDAASDAKPTIRRSPSLLQYLDSLERIADLKPGRALPGHGPVIEDVPKVLDRNRRHIARRAQAFADELGPEPMSPDALARAVFGRRDPVNHMLAVSETVAYLDLLERDGQARVDWDGPIRIHKS